MQIHIAAAEGELTGPQPNPGTLLSCRLDVADAPPGPPITILHLAGDVDLSTEPMVRNALDAGWHAATDPTRSTRGEAPGALIVDVAEVDYCGTEGLKQLARTARAAALAGANFSLAAPRPHLHRAAALLLSPKDRIKTYPTIAAAVRDIRLHRLSDPDRSTAPRH